MIVWIHHATLAYAGPKIQCGNYMVPWLACGAHMSIVLVKHGSMMSPPHVSTLSPKWHHGASSQFIYKYSQSDVAPWRVYWIHMSVLSVQLTTRSAVSICGIVVGLLDPHVRATVQLLQVCEVKITTMAA